MVAEFYISLQRYYYSGRYMVEIVKGGPDYAGSDMVAIPSLDRLGCSKTYTNPEEAVEVAVKVAREWKKIVDHGWSKKKNTRPAPAVHVSLGNTLGGGAELEPMSYKELRAQAARLLENLPKCQRCGEILGKETFSHDLVPGEFLFCSEGCANRDYEEQIKQDLITRLQEQLPEEVSREGIWSCMEFDEKPTYLIFIKYADGKRSSWLVNEVGDLLEDDQEST